MKMYQDNSHVMMYSEKERVDEEEEEENFQLEFLK